MPQRAGSSDGADTVVVSARVGGHPWMNSKTYSARGVNQVQLAPLIAGRAGRPMWVGVDVGKFEMRAVLHRGAGEFERPWRIANPADVRVAVEHFKQLTIGRELVVAMEPSGTYGDALRQACHDAGVVVHRV